MSYINSNERILTPYSIFEMIQYGGNDYTTQYGGATGPASTPASTSAPASSNTLAPPGAILTPTVIEMEAHINSYRVLLPVAKERKKIQSQSQSELDVLSQKLKDTDANLKTAEKNLSENTNNSSFVIEKYKAEIAKLIATKDLKEKEKFNMITDVVIEFDEFKELINKNSGNDTNSNVFDKLITVNNLHSIINSKIKNIDNTTQDITNIENNIKRLNTLITQTTQLDTSLSELSKISQDKENLIKTNDDVFLKFIYIGLGTIGFFLILIFLKVFIGKFMKTSTNDVSDATKEAAAAAATSRATTA